MTAPVETKFNFKARKIVDDAGKEVAKTKKQAPLVVALPMPTEQEIVDILCEPQEYTTNEKTGEQLPVENKKKTLILDAIQDIIRSQAKSQLDDVIESFGTDDTKLVTVESLDFDKLTLDYISTIPASQRGARALSEEEYAAFYADYLAVMVAATGKPEAKIKVHIDLFQKPTRIKQNKEALGVLVDQLDVYLLTSGNVEETAEVANRLRSKFARWKDEDTKFDLTAL